MMDIETVDADTITYMNLINLSLQLFIHFCVGDIVYSKAYVLILEDNLQELVLSFHSMDLGDQIQVIRLNSKDLSY